jgi:hypothetical protein
VTDDHEYCSYAEFGEAFFARAVTRDRVLGGIDGLAGQPIEFGPMQVGPGGIARVSANGLVGHAEARDVPGDEIAFHVELPIELDLALNLQVDTHRFHAELMVPLEIVAHATRDLKIVVDVTPPQAGDIGLDLKAAGIRATILQRAAGIEAELRRFVASYVAREVEKPRVAASRVVDVGAAIDASGSKPAPRPAD